MWNIVCVVKEMPMNVAERILKILEDTGLSARSFEMSIGKTSGYLNTLIKRGSSPSVEVIQKIVEMYPDYSLRWIVTGMGDIKERTSNILNEPGSKIQIPLNETLDTAFDRIVQKKIDSMKMELREEIMQDILNKIMVPPNEYEKNDN